MKRHYLLVAMIFLCCRTKAQYYFYNDRYYDSDLLFELGVHAGAMNCLTDLGGTKGEGKGFVKDLNLPYTKFTAGASAALLHRSTLGARLEFNAGTISASDAILKGDESVARYRYRRNLHFRSKIREIMLIGEWHPMPLFSSPAHKGSPSVLSPYLLAGVGWFHFNPQTLLSGAWIDLQPLRTEGQGFPEYPGRRPYRRSRLHVPTGVGIRYEASANMSFRLEFLHRFTGTDYLDDVSTTYIQPALFSKYLSSQNAELAQQLNNRHLDLNPGNSKSFNGAIRGSNKRNDTYFSVVLKISVILGRERIR